MVTESRAASSTKKRRIPGVTLANKPKQAKLANSRERRREAFTANPGRKGQNEGFEQGFCEPGFKLLRMVLEYH